MERECVCEKHDWGLHCKKINTGTGNFQHASGLCLSNERVWKLYMAACTDLRASADMRHGGALAEDGPDLVHA